MKKIKSRIGSAATQKKNHQRRGLQRITRNSTITIKIAAPIPSNSLFAQSQNHGAQPSTDCSNRSDKRMPVEMNRQAAQIEHADQQRNENQPLQPVIRSFSLGEAANFRGDAKSQNTMRTKTPSKYETKYKTYSARENAIAFS